LSALSALCNQFLFLRCSGIRLKSG
jgi:hypothetical protein